MLIRICLFLCFIQISFSQNVISPLLDSLSVASSDNEKSRISLKIASELSTADWKRAQYYMDIAEEAVINSKSDLLLADFFTETGEIYYNKEALDVALDYYIKAYEIYNEKGDSKKYKLENYLAIVYARVNNQDLALDYFNRVYSYQKKQKDTLAIAKTLNNIGNLYLGIQIDSSIIYYKKSLKIVKIINNNNLYFYLYTNLGRAYKIKEDYPSSKFYFNKAITRLDNEIDIRNKAWIYNEFSEYYLKINRPDSSIFFAKKSYKITDSLAPYSLSSLMSVELLYDSYKLNNEFEKATTYFEAYNNIRDTLNIEEKKVNVEKILIEASYKSKEKIQTLKDSKTRFKYYVIGLSLFTLLLLVTILLLKIKTKLKSTQLENELILAKRKELNASLEIKNNELIGKAMIEIHRTEIIDEILLELKNIKRKAVKKETQQAIDLIVRKLEKDTDSDLWHEFEVRFEQVHESFYKNLILKHPDLTSKDKRLCALLKLDLTSKEIAQITGQSFKSVENSRTRLRKKLDITNSKTELSSYLSSFS